jgi:hypothetical protein
MLNFVIKIILGGITLIDMYVALIIAGRRTFAQVPVKYQAGVHEDLLALGLDDNGNPL